MGEIVMKKLGDVKTSAKSLNTTMIGVIGALVLMGPQISNWIDGDPATICDWNVVYMGLVALFGGLFAKDGSKSSEDVGVK